MEIGPGKGHITRVLLKKVRMLTAIELDARLFAALRQKFSGAGNLRLVQQDFLTWPLPKTGPYKVFSNIPFAHTTAIVRKLLDAPHPPEDAWLIMEKGAANRFAGQPRHNAFSLGFKPFFDMRVVYHFQREDFHPKPSVDIVLLHIHKRSTPDIPPE